MVATGDQSFRSTQQWTFDRLHPEWDRKEANGERIYIIPTNICTPPPTLAPGFIGAHFCRSTDFSFKYAYFHATSMPFWLCLDLFSRSHLIFVTFCSIKLFFDLSVCIIFAKLDGFLPFRQCWGSVTSWYGSRSGSADPCHWLTDPDPDPAPDPTLFVSGCKMPTNNKIFSIFAYYFLKVPYIYISFHR